MSYQPYRIARPEIESASAPAYRTFLRETVLGAGIELLLARRRRRPDYPYPDTKFNPNTGDDYPESQYEILFTWFLGRGGEAASRHLAVLDSIDGLASRREEAREMLEGFVRAQNEAILAILDANGGRIPFRVDRGFRGVDEALRPVNLSAERCNASELFCAKALIAGGDPGEAEVGRKLFLRFLDAAFANGYEDDTAAYGRGLHAQSPFMLALAAFDYLAGEASRFVQWSELAARLLDYVLDRFWEPEAACFSELVDFATGERQPLFLPGHACELVGLGMQALSAFARAGADRLPAERRAAFERARRELPRILRTAYERGYDHTLGGMYHSVDARTGAVLNRDLAWWCLPEAMRAALHVHAAEGEEEEGGRALEILATASNDYFAHYPNQRMHLFPFRTRSGETGEVKNLMPVVPEADPLYHTNLAVIDMLALFDRLEL